MLEIDKIEYQGSEYKLFDMYHKFRFTCDKCGRCCSNIDIMLNPYDIIRITKKMKIPAKEFITKYCLLIEGHQSKLPILLLNTNPICVFSKDGLCQIYEDRPQVCRCYPIGRITSPDGDEKYMVVENCSKIPLRLQRFQTIQQWLENEKALEYYEITKDWASLISKICEKDYPKDDSKFFHLFVELCYNVDSDTLKNLLDKLNIKMPDNPKELFKIVIKNANILLLKYIELTKKGNLEKT